MTVIEPGRTAEDPIVLGTPNGAEPVKVRGLRNVGRILNGVDVWLTGSSVQRWIGDWYQVSA